MAQKDWDAHPLGGTSVFPVTGIKTATAMQGKAGVIRIEYGTEPTLTKRKAQQYLLTSKQLRSLSESLARLADSLDETASSGGPGGPVN